MRHSPRGLDNKRWVYVKITFLHFGGKRNILSGKIRVSQKIWFLCLMAFLTSFFSCAGRKEYYYTVSVVYCPLRLCSPTLSFWQTELQVPLLECLRILRVGFQIFSSVHSHTRSCSYISIVISVTLLMFLQMRLC